MRLFSCFLIMIVSLMMATMTAQSWAMDNETFQRRMNIAAFDLAMLNVGGRMLAKSVEACRAEHPEWDKAALDAYKTRVSVDLRTRMEHFLKNRLEDKDKDDDIADIRMLQREHREQLERKIPREAIASAAHLGVLVINQVDWACQSR